MKFSNLIYGLLVGGMLAACSDKDLAPNAGDVNNPSGDGASGYLAVQINLPQQQQSTKAEDDNANEGGSTTTDNGGQNDVYDDGEAWEYNVDNALIILFTGKAQEKTVGGKTVYLPNDASQITFLRAQELLKPFFWNEEANDNITTSYLAAIQVQNKNFQDGLWAIVMLNRDETKYIYDSDEEKVTINGKEIKTYKDLKDAVSSSDDDSDFIHESGSKKSIFMTNAPLSNVRGGSDNDVTSSSLGEPCIETLAYLGTAAQLYDTMEEAKENPAACIFVERAVAKVTYNGMSNGAMQLQFVQRVPMKDESGEIMKDADGNTIYQDAPLNSDGITVNESTVYYCLTNKNKKSYVIRNIDFPPEDGGLSHFNWALNSGNGDKFRMIGSIGMPALRTPFHKELKNLYRTYWCYDPNYAKEMANEDKITYKEGENSDFVLASKYPLYCKENTFTVKNQNHGNTTLAVIKVDFNISKKANGSVGTSNSNLYIRDDNKEKVYLTPEEAMAPVFERVYNDATIKQALKDLAKEGVEGTYEISTYIKVGYEVNNTDKKVTWNNVSLEVKEGDKFFPTTVSITENGETKNIPVAQAFSEKIGSYSDKTSYLYGLLSDLNNWFDVTEYTGGISYYVVPIKHFGDFSCPWDSKNVGITTKEVYNEGHEFTNNDDSHAHAYLGRYGMVRNNWYDINISEIKALGSAVPPVVKDDLSDDYKENNKYFAVEIHTLSWAKRTQNVEL